MMDLVFCETLRPLIFVDELSDYHVEHNKPDLRSGVGPGSHLNLSADVPGEPPEPGLDSLWPDHYYPRSPSPGFMLDPT